MRVFANRYQLDTVIPYPDSQANGQTWRGRDRDGAPVEVTLLNRTHADRTISHASVAQKRRKLTSLSSPYLVRVIDLVIDGNEIGVVREPVDGPSLSASILRRGTFARPDAMHVIADVLGALVVLHGSGLAHGSLNAANILLPQPEAAVLSGLGMAALDSSAAGNDITGAQSRDIYAAGMVLHQMLVGFALPQAEPVEFGVDDRAEETAEALAMPVGLPLELTALLRSMLDLEPASRPTAVVALAAVAEQLASLQWFDRFGGATTAVWGPSAASAVFAESVNQNPMVGQPADSAHLLVASSDDHRRGLPILVGAAAVVLLAGGGATYALTADHSVTRTLAGSELALPTPSPSGGLGTTVSVSPLAGNAEKGSITATPSRSASISAGTSPPASASRSATPSAGRSTTARADTALSPAVQTSPSAGQPSQSLSVRFTPTFTPPDVARTTVDAPPPAAPPTVAAPPSASVPVDPAASQLLPSAPPAQPPVIITAQLPPASVGVDYAASLVAEGSGPFTWALFSGNLPDGLTLNPGGSVMGRPLADSDETITLLVTDANSPPLTATVTLEIVVTG